MNFEEKKILVNSYFMVNFNYCPLVWMLSWASSLKKLENLQKRALRFLCNGYELSYEQLLSKSSTSYMNVKRLRGLCVELYKRLRGLCVELYKRLRGFCVELYKRSRGLCVELYKTINKLNPNLMRDLFKLRFTNRPVR